MSLTRDGQNYVGLCPFHDEKTPSFKIHRHAGVWLYKCFGCGKGGSVIDFVMALDHLDAKQAFSKIRKELGDAPAAAVDQTFKPVLAEATAKETYTLEQFAPLERALAVNDVARAWLVRERGIRYETAKALHFGFRQKLGAGAGKDNQDIADQGWLAFPSLLDRRVVSIKYRSLVRKAFARQANMATVLFNLDTIDPFETVYLVEGEFDTAVMEQAGVRAVSLPSGSYNPTPEMRDLLKQAETVVLAGDMTPEECREKLRKLWAELGDHTYLLEWPAPAKDANEFFLQACAGKEEVFQQRLAELTSQARAVPMPHVYSLEESLVASRRTNLAESPDRLRFPWKTVDRMAILLPGSIMTLTATQTKMGKTSLVAELTVHGARKFNEVVLNYQCELQADEFANLVAAQLLQKNRNTLTTEDYHEAAKRLHGVRYYIGYNPVLTKVDQVLNLLEQAIKRLGATIVVLDHLHFICRNEENEVQAQANAMQRIKNLAVKYRLKFIVVGQPRKAKQEKEGKLISITSMKGSEAIQADSTAAFIMHRNPIKNFDPENPPTDDYDPRTELHVTARTKGDGPSYAELLFIGETATFRELSRAEEPVNVI